MEACLNIVVTIIYTNLASSLDNHRHLNNLGMRLCIGNNKYLRGEMYEQRGFCY